MENKGKVGQVGKVGKIGKLGKEGKVEKVGKEDMIKMAPNYSEWLQMAPKGSK